jgi:predicted acylesterase/phospholipase RssA
MSETRSKTSEGVSGEANPPPYKLTKRAITLAGGGPAAGLHIGALARLQQEDINFDVWALSCIGGWVGIINNQWSNGDKAEQTYKFFRNGVFREDESYSRFPVNAVFAPDLQTNTRALIKFLYDPRTYEGLLLPGELVKATIESVRFWRDPDSWNSEGNFNHWVLNQLLAVQPLSRFVTSLLYLSAMNGLSRIYYEDSSFLNRIDIDHLFKQAGLFLYHNAWNLDKKEMELFSNIKKDGYGDITRQSLCACSALPYIEGTVKIDKDTYSEGALIETVNFSRLIEDHPDLKEIWVSRIVDVSQAEVPKNLNGALGNLCMLFAGSLGDDDVKLFQYHARDEGWGGTIYEMDFAAKNTPQPSKPYPRWMTVSGQDENVNFDWNWRNLNNGVERGYRVADELLNFRSCMQYYVKARQQGPDHPNYNQADYMKKLERALEFAQRLTRPTYALGQVARAATFSAAAEAHASGSAVRLDEAKEAIKRIAEDTKMPWRNSRKRRDGIGPVKRLKLELKKTFFDQETIEFIMNDLGRAGVGDILKGTASSPTPRHA